MIDPQEVSCIIPTRGNVDLTRVLESLPPFGEVIVADGSDAGLYARYAAIDDASNGVIVTQDDDLIVTCWDKILEAYEPGTLVCNYPQPWDIPWVARGAIFDWDLPGKAFARWEAAYGRDRDFTHFQCDGVFALLTETVKVIDYGSEDLPYCNDAGRISTESGWYDDKRPLITSKCAALQ